MYFLQSSAMNRFHIDNGTINRFSVYYISMYIDLLFVGRQLTFTISHSTDSVAAGVDPVLHTCQTVGRLSNKVARRVYRTVSRQVKLLKKEDVHEYVASLIAVLRLTQYLNFINEKVQAVEHTSTTGAASTSSNSNAHPEQPAAASAE